MRLKKQEKLKEEKFWATFYYFNVPSDPEADLSHFKRVNFRIWDSVTDDDVMRMNSRVTSIYQLDLDETDITNEAIESLTHIDYITELRLKGIRELNNNCVPFLNKINGLELLHIDGTSITLDGILMMSPSDKLQTLLFSHEQNRPPAEKMQALRQLFPACSFIVNHKSYYFEGDEQQDFQ